MRYGARKETYTKGFTRKAGCAEAKADLYAQAMLCGDFERNRIKWAAELVKIARLQKEIDLTIKTNHSPREGKYLSI